MGKLRSLRALGILDFSVVVKHRQNSEGNFVTTISFLAMHVSLTLAGDTINHPIQLLKKMKIENGFRPKPWWFKPDHNFRCLTCPNAIMQVMVSNSKHKRNKTKFKAMLEPKS